MYPLRYSLSRLLWQSYLCLLGTQAYIYSCPFGMKIVVALALLLQIVTPRHLIAVLLFMDTIVAPRYAKPVPISHPVFFFTTSVLQLH